MILSELNTILVNTAKSHYLVNEAFVGDVYTINSKENRFGCFVATPMTAVKLGTGTIRYRYVLYYIDRLTKAEDNIDFVQSDGVNVLKGILNFLDSNGGQIEEGYEFTLFRQKFSDWCAGAYVSVSIVVPDDDCGEYFNMSGNDLRPLNVDKNGIYTPGTFDGYNKVTINVPQVGATEEWVDDEIDLKLSSALTPYATFSYVDDQISGVRAELPDLTPYATKNWVNVQGYLSSCDLDPYATKVWVGAQGYLSSCDLEPYATRIWVENQGYVTTSLFSTTLSSYATKSWVSNNYVSNSFFTTTLSSYATKSWVSNNYVNNSTITSYATKSWISSQMFVTESWISSQMFVTESWISENSYMSASDMSVYLLKTNGNGTTSMVFGPELPYIYLKSGGNNMTIRPYQIAMQGPNAYTQVLTNQITIDQSTTSTMAGVWYEPNVSTCVLGVRNHSDEIGLMIDCRNIYFEEGEDNITSLPLSDLATKTWVSSQGYLTSIPDDYATKSWVSTNYFEESKIWTGTTSQWNDLTSEQKAFYTIALITE